MTQTRITKIDGSAAVLISVEIMEQMGIQIGDAVDVAVADNTLVVRRVDEETKPERTLDEIIDGIFERRADAYRRLAAGAE
jgi:antitoxin component of MazEF toxin-antitoxin module